MSKDIIIKNGNLKEAFEEIAEKSVLNNMSTIPIIEKLLGKFDKKFGNLGFVSFYTFLKSALEEAYNAGRAESERTAWEAGHESGLAEAGKTGDERRRFYQMGREEALRECVEVGENLKKGTTFYEKYEYLIIAYQTAIRNLL